MKTYQKQDGSLWSFEDDGSQDYLITDDMILITEEEAQTIRNQIISPPPTTEQLWSAYQRAAMAILSANDTVAIRCVKANVAYPSEWFACDLALRAIVHATSGDTSLPLPAQPITRPTGT